MCIVNKVLVVLDLEGPDTSWYRATQTLILTYTGLIPSGIDADISEFKGLQKLLKKLRQNLFNW